MVRRLKMLWMLAAALLRSLAAGISDQCWECRYISGKENLQECFQECHPYIPTETPTYPDGNQLQPQEAEEINQVEKEISLALVKPPQVLPMVERANPANIPERMFPPSHFRWAKPLVKKTMRIVKKKNQKKDLENEALTGELPAAAVNEVEKENNREVLMKSGKDGSYKMNHFRWNGPPAGKRFGTFLKSWDDEPSQQPPLAMPSPKENGRF